MLIGKSFTFDAAHWLPDYNGPCGKLHGHTWKVKVEVEGDVNFETGMVLDLKVLKQIIAPIIEKLDHSVLNDALPIHWLPPTCENLCRFLKVAVVNSLTELEISTTHLTRVTIQVQEGEGGWARTT